MMTDSLRLFLVNLGKRRRLDLLASFPHCDPELLLTVIFVEPFIGANTSHIYQLYMHADLYPPFLRDQTIYMCHAEYKRSMKYIDHNVSFPRTSPVVAVSKSLALVSGTFDLVPRHPIAFFIGSLFESEYLKEPCYLRCIAGSCNTNWGPRFFQPSSSSSLSEYQPCSLVSSIFCFFLTHTMSLFKNTSCKTQRLLTDFGPCGL